MIFEIINIVLETLTAFLETLPVLLESNLMRPSNLVPDVGFDVGGGSRHRARKRKKVVPGCPGPARLKIFSSGPLFC